MVQEGPGLPWASRAIGAGYALLALALPMAVMTYRSLPLLLGLSAACLLVGWSLSRSLQRPRDMVLVISLALFVVVAAMSLERMARPGDGFEVLFGHAALPVALGVMLACADPPAPGRRVALALAGGLAAAALLLLVELRTDLVLHRLTGANLNPSKMNQSAVTMALWMWPILLLAAAALGRMAALGLAILVTVAVFLSESETAKLALAAGAIAFAVFQWRRPWLFGALAVAVTLLVLSQPLLPSLVDTILPEQALDALESAHARERLVIWRSFAAATAMEPMAGFGFDSSGEIGFGPLLERFPEELRTGIRDSHPHNMALQVWVELGLMGAFLVAVALGRIIRAAGRLDPSVTPAAAGAIVAALLVAAVGYGAWQAWWLSSLAMLPVLLGAAAALKAARA
jgi:O-antigen ligase